MDKLDSPCENYSGKMAGDYPCAECGWLYSEHKPASAKPNAWKAGRPPSRKSKVNRSDNEGGKNLVKSDPLHAVAERDDPAYKTFAEYVGGKDGLKELLSWSENPKAQKFLEILDSEHFQTYGIKALAKRCGMTLPELCNLFRERHFLVSYLTFFAGTPAVVQGAIEDASPKQDVCPVCIGAGTIKRDGFQVICPKCEGSGKVRVSGDKDARRDIFKAVGLLKDSPSVINQQIGNVTVEGVDNFEEVMKRANKSAKIVITQNEQETTEAEIVE